MYLDENLHIESQFADILKMYTEADLTTLPPIASITNRLRFGVVVCNPADTDLPHFPRHPEQNQYDGLVTIAFRVRCNFTAAADPFSISFRFLAIEDPVTRVTESIEDQAPDGRAAVAGRGRTRDRIGSSPQGELPAHRRRGHPKAAPGQYRSANHTVCPRK